MIAVQARGNCYWIWQNKEGSAFGLHSMAVMDYGGVRPFALPGKNYSGYVPPTRSIWAFHGKIANSRIYSGRIDSEQRSGAGNLVMKY